MHCSDDVCHGEGLSTSTMVEIMPQATCSICSPRRASTRRGIFWLATSVCSGLDLPCSPSKPSRPQPVPQTNTSPLSEWRYAISNCDVTVEVAAGGSTAESGHVRKAAGYLHDAGTTERRDLVRLLVVFLIAVPESPAGTLAPRKKIASVWPSLSGQSFAAARVTCATVRVCTDP